MKKDGMHHVDVSLDAVQRATLEELYENSRASGEGLSRRRILVVGLMRLADSQNFDNAEKVV